MIKIKFKYEAIDRSSNIVKGVYECDTELEVIVMLKANNLLPIDINKHTEKKSINKTGVSVKKKDIAVLCRQLYVMVDAGMSVVRSVGIIKDQTESKRLSETLSVVHEDLQKGMTLSEAMIIHEDIFPNLLISMVAAGEYSGNLDSMLERMSIYYEKENRLENKIKSAMIYPSVLGVASTGVVIFMLVFVLPIFIEMFEDSGQELPSLTQSLIDFSSLLTGYWYVFIVVIATLIYVFNAYRKTHRGKLNIDTWKLKIPIIKDTNIKIITSRFSRTMSTLMSGGMPLIQSMGVVGNVVGNQLVKERLEKATEEIKKGNALSDTISGVGLFPMMVSSMIKIGEESGSIDNTLLKTADYYDEEVEVALQKMAALAEPVMLIIMAIVVGYIVIAMALPMFDMAGTI